MSAHIFNFDSVVRNAEPNTLTGQEEVKKTLRKLFDKSDLVPDSERKDVIVYNNEVLMKHFPVLRQLSEPIVGNTLSFEALEDIFLNEGIDLAVNPSHPSL